MNSKYQLRVKQSTVNSKNMSSHENIYNEYPTTNEIIYRETQLVQHSVQKKKSIALMCMQEKLMKTHQIIS